MGHDYVGHNYMGHDYVGHNYTSHNYIVPALVAADGRVGRVRVAQPRPDELVRAARPLEARARVYFQRPFRHTPTASAEGQIESEGAVREVPLRRTL